MNKRMTALLLTGVLACSLAAPAAAADRGGLTISARPQNPLIAANPDAQAPDCELYYGVITQLVTDEGGALSQILMESERYGAYAMNISDRTVFVDSSAHSASDAKTLAVGEGIYVYHSPMSTRSLPPQTEAYAVVRNLPMDTSAAHYHRAEAVVERSGQGVITVQHGTLTLIVDADTEVKHLNGNPASLSDIQPDRYVLAWYEGSGEVHADHLLLLPLALTEEPEGILLPEEAAAVTRADLALALHAYKGRPAVDYLMTFTDIPADAMEREAIRWAASEGILNGYSDTDFGYEEYATLEQVITALWRMNRSPRLMDYPGLTQYEDAGDISPYAAPALAWAHQQQLLDREAIRLHPGSSLSRHDLNQLLAALDKR